MSNKIKITKFFKILHTENEAEIISSFNLIPEKIKKYIITKAEKILKDPENHSATSVKNSKRIQKFISKKFAKAPKFRMPTKPKKSISDLIVDIHIVDLSLFSRNDERFEISDLSPHEQKVFTKIYDFLEDHDGEKLNIDDIKLQDGSKKTLILNNSSEVLKIYPWRGIYDKEKKSYQTVKELGVEYLFVPQYDWDNDSMTARAIKLDSVLAKVEAKANVSYFLKALEPYGYTLTDLKHGDNIGMIRDENIIFDIKSLRKL